MDVVLVLLGIEPMTFCILITPLRFLDKVFIINETTSQRWIFPCNRWLAKREDDGKTERTLFPGDGLTTTYNIKVKTGLEKGAGTDANVKTSFFIDIHYF